MLLYVTLCRVPGASQIQGTTSIVAPVPVFLNPEGSSSGGSAFASPVSRTSAQPQQPQPTLSTQQEEPSDWSSAEGSIQPVLPSPQAQHFSHNRAVEISSTMDSPQVRSIAQVTTATTSTVNSVPGGRLYLRTVVERQTQTEKRIPCWRQLLYCLAGDDRFRRQRQRQAAAEAAMALKLTGGRANGVPRMAGLSSATAGRVNSVSQIDRAARILFPASFGLLNLFYWTGYVIAAGNEFTWKDVPGIKN
ncbi:hypothetical protein J437_LFUL000022 [Ladona fulva]|uniref:Uncharacterized protein n=1 Tax=Ladona fulva TaxID=123851 RepID=A0A8K0JZR5_LADFU|nr:hypothetical protein J437_LFUL000022 [Ladona fulva]